MNSCRISIALVSVNNTIALGLRTLSATLKRSGINRSLIFLGTSQFNIDVHTYWPKLKTCLQAISPKYVGFSVTSLHSSIVKELSAHVHDEFNLPVIWGGIHPTISPADSLEYCDYVCVGEGELSLTSFLAQSSCNSSLMQRGIWSRKPESLSQTGISDIVEDLNWLPFPDFEDNDSYYISEEGLTRHNPFRYEREEYVTMVSRGCPYDCSYCCAPYLKRQIGTHDYCRLRSVSHVISELKYARKLFPEMHRVIFFDDVFPSNSDWVEKFSTNYSQEIKLPFTIFTNPNSVRENLFRLLADAGLDCVCMGIQSGDQEIRRNIFHRTETDERICEAATIFHKNKLRTHYDFIFSTYDSYETKERGYQLLKKIPRPFSTNVFWLSYFKGAPITKKALQEGQITYEDIIGHASHPGCEIDYSFARNMSLKDDVWYYLYELAGSEGAIRLGIILTERFVSCWIGLRLVRFLYRIVIYGTLVREWIMFRTRMKLIPSYRKRILSKLRSR